MRNYKILFRFVTVNSNLIKYPDFNNTITTITTAGTSYTATQNCWVIGNLSNGGSADSVYLYLNNKQVAGFYKQDKTVTYNYYIMIPVKTGDVIRTFNTGVYVLTIYGTI